MELSQFTNQYSLSKTLRFKLIPTEATKSNLERDMILATDQKRADEYIVVKKLLDRYHKEYIERKLSTFSFPHTTLDHYYKCYFECDRENRADDLEEAQKAMMQQVSEHLRCFANKKPGEEYNKLFSKQMVKTILPEYLTDEKEKETVRLFSEFWTYLSGYCQNRENMYTGEGKATEIAYRIVKQNLPKFLDNLRVWEKIKKELPESDIKAVDEVMERLIGMTSETVFTVHSFNNFLTQSGIEKFNQFIGGYTNEDGSKVQGVNEKINLYSQSAKKRLPKFKPLFKQILSDRDSMQAFKPPV